MENITIDNVNSDMNIDVIKLQKMALIYNSLENGWTVKKHPTKDVYIFTKNHGGKNLSPRHNPYKALMLVNEIKGPLFLLFAPMSVSLRGMSRFTKTAAVK